MKFLTGSIYDVFYWKHGSYWDAWIHAQADKVLFFIEKGVKDNSIMALTSYNDNSSAELNNIGLPGDYFYFIGGTYNLTDSSGKVIHKLILVKNPWGLGKYAGRWNDIDP